MGTPIICSMVTVQFQLLFIQTYIVEWSQQHCRRTKVVISISVKFNCRIDSLCLFKHLIWHFQTRSDGQHSLFQGRWLLIWGRAFFHQHHGCKVLVGQRYWALSWLTTLVIVLSSCLWSIHSNKHGDSIVRVTHIFVVSSNISSSSNSTISGVSWVDLLGWFFQQDYRLHHTCTHWNRPLTRVLSKVNVCKAQDWFGGISSGCSREL